MLNRRAKHKCNKTAPKHLTDAVRARKIAKEEKKYSILTRIPLILDRIVIPAGDRSNVELLIARTRWKSALLKIALAPSRRYIFHASFVRPERRTFPGLSR